MATTAVAPSAAAASGDADSGMSKYYASKIGELSAVSCVRAKGLRGCSLGACFVRLSLTFGALPIFGCVGDAEIPGGVRWDWSGPRSTNCVLSIFLRR